MLEFDRYILIDEFSGTGQTIIKRVEWLAQRAKEMQAKAVAQVCVMFGMRAAAAKLKAESVDCQFVITLPAGLSDHFSGEELEKKTNAMIRLEQELAPTFMDKPMPSFGHGKAEALFFIVHENAPNSNFPIYWWPLDSNGNDRDTVMHRDEP